MNEQMGTGAYESQKDSRTVKHEDVAFAVAPLITGGIDYLADDILNQASVGICTAISLIQNRNKANGKVYSADFQYLLQKKYYDGNWTEGSSIFNALKVGKNYGFLPESLWTHTTQVDRTLPYSQYIEKLQAIPDAEVQRLLGLCVDKIAGYASVDVTDPQAIALAVNNSDAGILCMYYVGAEWWTPSWQTKDIDPLRPPQTIVSGHAINLSKFDYTEHTMQKLANTWSSLWDLQGSADINWDNYKMREAWTILDVAPPIPAFSFQHDLYYGETSPDIIQLQKVLNKSVDTQVAQAGDGSAGHETSYFGYLTLNAVKRFQAKYLIPQTGYVGKLTRARLNSLI